MAQIVDPTLIADIIKQLNVRGALAPFEIAPVAVAVFDIGRLTGLDVQSVVTPGLAASVLIGLEAANFALTTREPFLAAADVFDDITLNPLAGVILADTGAVAAGVTSFKVQLSQTTASGFIFEIQWRNAANAATLASFPFTKNLVMDFVANMALNERIRLVNVNNITATVASYITASPSASQIAS